MFAPLASYGEWSNGTIYAVAFIIGIGFGFSLERGGLGNSRVMAMFFYLRNMTVLKVLFGAIVVGMTGILITHGLGWLDTGDEVFYIPRTFLYPMMAGGAIMGIGFAIGSYCPGTSVVGMATLKIDSFFFYFGLIVGMFIFAEAEPLFHEFYAGTKSGDMGVVTLPQMLGISPWIVWAAVVVMAGAGFYFGEKAEKKFGSS